MGSEVIAALATLVIVVAVIPRIRDYYVKSQARRIDIYRGNADAPEPQEGESSESLPLLRGNLAKNEAGTAEEFVGEGSEGEDVDTSASAGPAGTEIWRFVLRTASPRDLRLKVVQMLRELHVNADAGVMGGVEAPGGIQFDLLVPHGLLNPLKDRLARAVASPQGAQQEGGANLGETFNWYKNRSKKKLPPGRARVVIWLSQI